MTNHKKSGSSSSQPRSTVRSSPSSLHAAPRVRRKTRYILAAIICAAVLVGVLVLALGPGSGSNASSRVDIATSVVTGPSGPEGVPLEVGKLLAPESSAAAGSSVDNVACDTTEQVAYHVHVHLSVFVDGKPRPIPAGIGIVAPVPQATADGPFDSASNCYYWLHVHAQDGVIHIESPTARSYTLGQFFDLWHQSLSPTHIAGVTGKLVVFVNGVRDLQNPRTIQLSSHLDIQIEVGEPLIAPRRVDWARTQL